jgi:NADPH-dependent curcumin reductase CurA
VERTINRQWILTSRPKGIMSKENFTYKETEIPKINEGEILVRNIFLSFEPVQQRWITIDGYTPKLKLDLPMRSLNVAQVVESKHQGFVAGNVIFCEGGWQDYCIVTPSKFYLYPPEVLPAGLDPRFAGYLYSTGLAGYFGMVVTGDPKPGDVVFVTTAAGSVGIIAAQIAKLKGARVIGSASNDIKCEWLLKTAKLDGAINYKKESLDKRLSELCPNGIDIMFDLVGGETMEIGIDHLRKYGKIIVGAAISQTLALQEPNPANPIYGIKNIPKLTVLRGRIEGYIDMDNYSRKSQSVEYLKKCVDNGDIKLVYDMREGFENIPDEVPRMFRGENLGKSMMQINPIE